MRCRSRAVAPALLPRPGAGQPRTALVDPDAVFLNSAARERLGVAEAARRCGVQHGSATIALRVAGSVAAAGPPLAVMDIAGAQAHFGLRAPADAHRPAARARRTTRTCCAAGAAARAGAPRAPTKPQQRAVEPVARLPRQPHGAGAGGAVRRRVPGVLGGRRCRWRSARRPSRCSACSGLTARERPRAGAGRVRAARRGSAACSGWRWARCSRSAGARAGWPATWAAATFPASRRRCSSAPGRARCWLRRAAARPRRWPAAGCRRAQRASAGAGAGARRAWALRTRRAARAAPWRGPAVAALLGVLLALRAAASIGLPLAAYLSVGAAAVRRRGAGAGWPSTLRARARSRFARPGWSGPALGPLPLLAVRARASRSAIPRRWRWPAWWPAWRCRWR